MKPRTLSVGMVIVISGFLIWASAPYIAKNMLTETVTMEIAPQGLDVFFIRIQKGDVVNFTVEISGEQNDIVLYVERVHFSTRLTETGISKLTFKATIHDPGLIYERHSASLRADVEGHFTFYFDNTFSDQSKIVKFTYFFEKSTNVEYITTVIRNFSVLFGVGVVLLGLLPRPESKTGEGSLLY